MKLVFCSLTMSILGGCGSVYSTVTSDTYSPVLMNEYTVGVDQRCQSNRFDETNVQYNKNGTITCREYKDIR